MNPYIPGDSDRDERLCNGHLVCQRNLEVRMVAAGQRRHKMFRMGSSHSESAAYTDKGSAESLIPRCSVTVALTSRVFVVSLLFVVV
jgi:hypothetical protein